MYKENHLYTVTKVQTTHCYILYTTVNMASEVLHIVLVYFSVVSKQEDKNRNERLKKEVEDIIAKAKQEQEAVMILGDFNGHTGLLGKQWIAKNNG